MRGLDANDFTAATKSAQVKNGTKSQPICTTCTRPSSSGPVRPETDLPVFTDADIRGVMSKSMKVIERITTIVNRLSGMDDKGSKEGVGSSGKRPATGEWDRFVLELAGGSGVHAPSYFSGRPRTGPLNR